MTWQQALEHCNSTGAHLANMETEEEFNAVNEKVEALNLKNQAVWTGLHHPEEKTDSRKEDWRWAHNMEAPALDKWKAGEPDNFAGRQHCAVLEGGLWSDVDCNSKGWDGITYHAFCEIQI